MGTFCDQRGVVDPGPQSVPRLRTETSERPLRNRGCPAPSQRLGGPRVPRRRQHRRLQAAPGQTHPLQVRGRPWRGRCGVRVHLRKAKEGKRARRPLPAREVRAAGHRRRVVACCRPQCTRVWPAARGWPRLSGEPGSRGPRGSSLLGTGRTPPLQERNTEGGGELSRCPRVGGSEGQGL